MGQRARCYIISTPYFLLINFLSHHHCFHRFVVPNFCLQWLTLILSQFLVVHSQLLSSESEGSFQYGNYRREADDLHSVVEYFNGANRKVTAVLGHSKGVSTFANSCIIYWEYFAHYGEERGFARELLCFRFFFWGVLWVW